MNRPAINQRVSFLQGGLRRRRLIRALAGVLALLMGIAGVDGGAVAFAQPDEFFGSSEAWTTNPYYGTRGTFFADADGLWICF